MEVAHVASFSETNEWASGGTQRTGISILSSQRTQWAYIAQYHPFNVCTWFSGEFDHERVTEAAAATPPSFDAVCLFLVVLFWPVNLRFIHVSTHIVVDGKGHLSQPASMISSLGRKSLSCRDSFATSSHTITCFENVILSVLNIRPHNFLFVVMPGWVGGR